MHDLVTLRRSFSTWLNCRRRFIRYYHNDHIATPQKMTDGSGTVAWSADYKPFGETTVTVSTITNNLRFPGQYFDAETGLNYNYFRDYNQVLGRYIESDPIGLKDGINLYSYVKNNPVRFIDRLGLYRYSGQATYTSGGEAFGGGVMRLTLTTECYNHKRQIGKFDIIFGGVTGGIPLGQTNSSLTVDDHIYTGGPKLSRLTGWSYLFAPISLAVPGLGVGVGILQMGDGTADLTGSNDGGIDLSIDFMVGRSRLIEAREECCN